MNDPLIDFVDSVCVQTAVHWKKGDPNEFGEYEFEDAVEVYCRWDGKQQQIVDENGDEIVSTAEILLDSQAVVQTGDYLLLGDEGSLETDQVNDPLKAEKARRVKSIQETPLFQSTSEFVKVAYV